MNKALENSNLDVALNDARQRYVDNNPESSQAHLRAKDFMPGGNTRTVLFSDPFPLRMVSGREATVTDVDGHTYLNLLGEYTAGLFGHSNQKIRASIDRALDQGINLSAHNNHEIKLAELVTQRFRSIDRVRFTNSGTEANLMAIATARFVTGKNKVMVFYGGYHGGLLYFGNGGIPINAPYEFIVAEYNNNDVTAELIRENQDDLACILVEPMMGSAGCIPGRQEFLTMLRDECDRSNATLIFDEVMTSRLSPGGAQQLYQVTPDMTTLGKYIGGGMSFGAFGGRSDIMDIYNPELRTSLPHAGTFNNNTLTMAAGCTAMGEVFTPEVSIQINLQGELLRQNLNQICQELSAPVQFTGTGSLMNLHGTRDEILVPADLVGSDDRIKELIYLDLLERGYYIARRGFIALMLSVTDDDLAGFSAAFKDILEQRQSDF